MEDNERKGGAAIVARGYSMIEIRWHGRGGQGAKTAALLLADVGFSAGLYVQGFPEYGPERMGAPITAYNRLSKDKIRVHSNIYEPDMVVVVDETLLKTVDVAAGLKIGGKLLVNTGRAPADVLAGFGDIDAEIYVIDAVDIAVRAIGRPMPNSPLLSAVIRLSGIMGRDEAVHAMEEAFKEKFHSKPEIVEGNMTAVMEAWSSVLRINE
ncbi:MAG: 2-oxoacid:acceptor oxidoreductase family protein [Clostridiales Family XIII bacterium]|jgi:pyruvate ferredoxin oxidoreductase gamma subunit|nr:2-oxoacid:acceptor oxidoreductase family protein [Clostridiales Family XIII bacterium]